MAITPEDIPAFARAYPDADNNVLAQQYGVTREKIIAVAHNLGLKKTDPNYWRQKGRAESMRLKAGQKIDGPIKKPFAPCPPLIAPNGIKRTSSNGTMIVQPGVITHTIR